MHNCVHHLYAQVMANDDYTTIRVPRALHARIASLSRARATTLIGVLEQAVQAQESDQFWEQVHSTMHSPSARSRLQAVADEARAPSRELTVADEYDWSTL